MRLPLGTNGLHHVVTFVVMKRIESVYLGPVVQSIVSLTSLLVVKILTVLVKYNILFTGIFAGKNVSKLCNVSRLCKCKSNSLFSAKTLVYMPYLMNKVLTIH